MRTDTWFYDEEKTEKTNLNNFDKVLLEMEIKRSVFTHVFSRRCKKVDEMLGEIFGMMGLLSAVFFGLYSGFNGWALEQSVRRSFGLPFAKPTLTNYYRHVLRRMTYKLCGCCCQKNE